LAQGSRRIASCRCGLQVSIVMSLLIAPRSLSGQAQHTFRMHSTPTPHYRNAFGAGTLSSTYSTPFTSTYSTPIRSRPEQTVVRPNSPGVVFRTPAVIGDFSETYRQARLSFTKSESAPKPVNHRGETFIGQSCSGNPQKLSDDHVKQDAEGYFVKEERTPSKISTDFYFGTTMKSGASPCDMKLPKKTVKEIAKDATLEAIQAFVAWLFIRSQQYEEQSLDELDPETREVLGRLAAIVAQQTPLAHGEIEAMLWTRISFSLRDSLLPSIYWDNKQNVASDWDQWGDETQDD